MVADADVSPGTLLLLTLTVLSHLTERLHLFERNNETTAVGIFKFVIC